ncbi:hypothetical protein DFQ27_003229 [Actinomortierella ambigua]|uniref:Uncharacterized protein n=1 Tax=Actinomortierella ambigua TaxID=1343610 RepID=A0A9P6Q750_9FUNG|nr:hypothetical protein DFQ27_003229 [Actinomortierella ambigua]
MRFSKVILLVASATLALAQQGVISKGILIGEDKTDKNAKGAEIYKNPRNHQTAASSIIVSIANALGYEPRTQDSLEAAQNYEALEESFLNLPGFEVLQQDEVELHLTGDLDQIEGAIKEGYPDLGSDSVAKALRELIPSSSKNTRIKRWLLSVVVIDLNPQGNVCAKLFSLLLTLYVSSDGKVMLPTQQISYLNVINSEIDSDNMAAKANTLFEEYGVTTTQEFEEYFTSSKENVLTQWLYPDTRRQSVLDF